MEYWKPSHKLNNTLYKIQLLLVVMNFINISIFLRYGVKPLLIERFLALDQEYASKKAPRLYGSKYMARELLWNGFIVRKKKVFGFFYNFFFLGYYDKYFAYN